MTWTWQDLIALTLVVAAAGYLVRASWRVLARKKSPGCGTCAKCPSTGATDSGTPVVSLEVTSLNKRNQA